MKEAKYYKFLANKKIKCNLCPHYCHLSLNQTGWCGVRTNINNRLITNIYGQLSSLALDPIEKKPLYHFLPGTEILSVGTTGCNLKCPFCQNWAISQEFSEIKTFFYSPQDLVDLALAKNIKSIAYTYSEPIVWFEYVWETAKLAQENNLKNVLVTNGFINPAPLKDLLPYIDAVNLDLKSFNPAVYQQTLKGGLEEVKKSLEEMLAANLALEITTLVVTGLNDKIEEMESINNYLSSLDSDIPWHLSRYYSNYNYQQKATEIDFMLEIFARSKEKLNFVYLGNCPGEIFGQNTICPNCQTVLIERHNYKVYYENIDKKGQKCLNCSQRINVIF